MDTRIFTNSARSSTSTPQKSSSRARKFLETDSVGMSLSPALPARSSRGEGVRFVAYPAVSTVSICKDNRPDPHSDFFGQSYFRHLFGGPSQYFRVSHEHGALFNHEASCSNIPKEARR